MNNRKLKKNIASYGALTAAFLASGTYEAEAQIVYMDPADIVLQATAGLDITNAFDNGGSAFRAIDFNTSQGRLNILNGTFMTSNSSISRNTAVPSNNPYLAFRAEAFVSASRYLGRQTFSIVKIYGRARAGSSIKDQSNGDALNIPYGDNIDSNSGSFYSSSANLGIAGVNPPIRRGKPIPGSVNLNSLSKGNFVNDPLVSEVEGYIGFRFDKNGQNHFGWARVKLEIVNDVEDLSAITEDPAARNVNTRETSTTTTTLTIMDYAYNDTPDTAIAAGAMPAAAIPTMGQWGLTILNLMLLIFGIVAVKDRERLIFEKKA